eukprot:gene7428-58815_t
MFHPNGRVMGAGADWDELGPGLLGVVGTDTNVNDFSSALRAVRARAHLPPGAELFDAAATAGDGGEPVRRTVTVDGRRYRIAACAYGGHRLALVAGAALADLAADLDRFSRLDFAPSRRPPPLVRVSELAQAPAAKAAPSLRRGGGCTRMLWLPALLPQPWAAIGEGSFGRVYRARFLRTAGDVAVKELLPSKRHPTKAHARRARFIDEMRHLERVRVKYVVMFYGWTVGPGGGLCMVTELLCAAGAPAPAVSAAWSPPGTRSWGALAASPAARTAQPAHDAWGTWCTDQCGVPCPWNTWHTDQFGAPCPWAFGCLLLEVLSGAPPWAHVWEGGQEQAPAPEGARRDDDESQAAWRRGIIRAAAAGGAPAPGPGGALCRALWTGAAGGEEEGAA